MPKWTSSKPPSKPNVYSDGSVHNPASHFWQVGGIGVFWPRRSLTDESLSDTEYKYMHTEQRLEGVRLWSNFNNLRNSSTRCEIGAAMVALSTDQAVNIGIDSLATIRKGDKSSSTKRKKRRRSYTTTTVPSSLEEKYRHYTDLPPGKDH